MKENEGNKGGFGGIIAVIIIILIIVAVLMFLFGDGFGFGSGGDGFGNPAVPAEGSISETSADAQDENTDTTGETSSGTNYIDVTVSEDHYLYQNSSYELSDLIETLKAIEGDLEVHITIDESASANAHDDLLTALDDNNIPYAVVTQTTE